MTRRTLAQSVGLRYLLIAASLAVIIAGLKAGAPIFVPTLLGVFIAATTFPMIFTLRRRKVPAPLAILVALAAVIGVLAGLTLMFLVSISRVSRELPRYQTRLQEITSEQLGLLERIGFDTENGLFPQVFDLEQTMAVVTNTFVGLASAASFSFLVLLIAFFTMLESIGFRDKLTQAFGRRKELLERVNRVIREVQRYLVIKTAISLVTGLAIGLWVALLGVDFPRLWGFVAFVFNYVPTIGSVMAGVPAVLLAWVQYGPGMALATAAGYIAVNILLGNILEPNLLGRTLSLSPLVVILSLVFWGWVWGPVGMLLSVPMTMVVKIMLENTDELRWISVLLAHSPRRDRLNPPPPELPGD